uniref:Uncharacterized protein n=1 Tax=Corvus moneduloides TaxID=1196302 RepID=A0A8C3E7G5_CORMO
MTRRKHKNDTSWASSMGSGRARRRMESTRMVKQRAVRKTALLSVARGPRLLRRAMRPVESPTQREMRSESMLKESDTSAMELPRYPDTSSATKKPTVSTSMKMRRHVLPEYRPMAASRGGHKVDRKTGAPCLGRQAENVGAVP